MAPGRCHWVRVGGRAVCFRRRRVRNDEGKKGKNWNILVITSYACIVALSAMSATLDKVSIDQMSVPVRGQLKIMHWLNSTSDCNHR